MRVALVGIFAADYLISLANGLAELDQVCLFPALQDLKGYFPRAADPVAYLRDRELLHPAIEVCPIDYPTGRFPQKIRLVSGLLAQIRDTSPDIVHIQSSGGPWIPLLLPFLKGVPVVATIHDVTHHPGDWPPGGTLRLINTLVTRFSRQVIVHGQQQADLLVRLYHVSREKVNVIPIGPYGLFRCSRAALAKPEAKTVLFFGRLRAYKGLDVLVQAAPQVAARIPGVRFVVAGAGESPSLAEAAAAHPEWFEIHNRFIEADEVADFFERATLLVQPYLEASQSGVLPLAALFRRPVVATRVGSIPEVMEDWKTGILVEPGDPVGLAKAIIRLLEDPEACSRMGKAAEQSLGRGRSWGAIADATHSVYERARAIPARSRKPGLATNHGKGE